MRNALNITAFLLAILGASLPAESAVMVKIQPSQDMESVIWSVAWDSLSGVGGAEVAALGFIDPSSGQFYGNYLEYHRQAGWIDVGDYLGQYFINGGDFAYVDRWYTVSSDTPGWLVCPAGNPDGQSDSIYFGNDLLGYDEEFPTSGEFVITIPGGLITDYNPGIYTENANITVIVTTTPVPEPSLPVLMGLSAILLATRRHR